MFHFFDWLFKFLTEVFPQFLIDFFMWIMTFVGYLVLKVINIIFDHVIPLFSTEAFDKSAIWEGLESAWSGLPYEVMQIATYIRIPEAISIVTSALLINFIKKKIPFIGK